MKPRAKTPHTKKNKRSKSTTKKIKFDAHYLDGKNKFSKQLKSREFIGTSRENWHRTGTNGK